MEATRLCPYCLQPLPGAAQSCPHCGKVFADRNPGGMVIAAKNAEKAAKLNDAFQGKADAKSVAAGAAAVLS